MKILHIITGLSIGGAEKALFNILNNGLNEAHENHIISLTKGGELEHSMQEIAVSVKSLEMHKGILSINAITKLKKSVKTLHPDVIQGWMYHGNFASYIAKQLTNYSPPLLWNIRTCLYSLKNQKPMTRFVIRANQKLSNCPESIIYNSLLSKFQHESFGFKANAGINIPNGIDVKMFSPDTKLKLLVRDKIHIPRNAIVIGHVARFHAVKDHINFLQAAASIVENNDHVYFLMIGKQITRDNKELNNFITENLSKRLTMLGQQNDISNYMKAIDLFCISSAWGEAFPNVVGEAMASGVPCIATDIGDCSRIIDNTGIIVPPKNNTELINALQIMLSMPEKERVLLGKSARQRIINHYSIVSIVKRYSDLYTKFAN